MVREGMARTRRNPRGLPVKHLGATLVLVGERGEHTHLYNPHSQLHACKSGINAGRGGPSGAMPRLIPTDAKVLTCYRCVKLASYNIQRYGDPVPREP